MTDLSDCTTMHADVCPDCGAVTTHHMLDPVSHCPHGFERRVPVEFVIRDDYDRLRAEVERLREAFTDLHEEALDMRSYVPDYFAKKWKHDEALERAKTALSIDETEATP